MKHGKKYTEAAKLVDCATFYEPNDAIAPFCFRKAFYLLRATGARTEPLLQIPAALF